MLNRHEHEKKQFRRLFQQEGLDRFEERFQVLEAFLKLDHHVSLEEVSDQLKADGVAVDKSFLKESMEDLCRFGFANRVAFDREDKTLYEHRHLGVHHDHMICTECGNITEFVDEAIEERQHKIADEFGFKMQDHSMQLYGICKKCQKK